jgi:oxygen-independent coproporphyrinogen-3 oxidase
MQPYSLYVHIPFCTAKCTYCDFNSYAGQDSMMQPYADAVALEARLWSTHVAGRRVETVFFGGGTPSLLPLPEMRVIIEALRARFDIEPGAEFSLEANPGTVDAAHLAGLRELGFNRISFGVQSFHDDELRTLERIHDADEVEDAYRWAREGGFENVNLDLIYGLQGQTMQGWQTNLERALGLAPDHLSLYALTLEEGTPMTRDVERGRQRGPDLDLQADMFEWSLERMTRAGFQHYEISNWSRPGRECRHNLVYWHNGDWLGLGAGAHSHLLGERFADAASPRRYIELVTEAAASDAERKDSTHVSLLHVGERRGERRHDSGPASSARKQDSALKPEPSPLGAMSQVVMREPPDEAREMAETAFLALRLREGLEIGAFERRFGVDIKRVFGNAIEETMALGLTEQVDGWLRVKDEAVLVGDEAFVRFLEPAPIEA